MKNIIIITILIGVFIIGASAVKSDGYGLGSNNAPVTIVEYSDFQCPWCKKFELYVLPEIYKNFIKKGYVRLIFKDFPLINIHAFAYKAAKYADCSGDYYMKIRYFLYEYQNDWNKKGNIYEMLKEHNMPYLNSIRQCAESDYSKSYIQKSMRAGDNLGIQATPTFTIFKKGVYQEMIKGYYNYSFWYATLVFLLSKQLGK